MSAVSSAPRQLLVCGDVTVDWNLARVEPGERTRQWTATDHVIPSARPGGAVLLGEVVRRAVTDGTVCRPPETGRAAVQCYALWRQFPAGGGSRSAWRVDEYLGVEPTSQSDGYGEGDALPADVLVVDDAALGFRDDPHRWPTALREGDGLRWLVAKTSAPVMQGPLWEHLLGAVDARLVVVMTIGDLRRSDVQISRELSWERTAQDLVWELAHNPRINPLARRATVVVSFGAAGALVVPAAGRASLVFDASVVEGMWEAEHPGGMVGATVALTAGVVREIADHGDDADLVRGVTAGLHALRALHAGGYDALGDPDDHPELAFPTERVVGALGERAPELSVAVLPDGAPEQAAQAPFWTILRDRHPGPLSGVARRVVVEGVERALGAVPVGRFGALVTVDRHEIEAYREVRALVAEYAAHPAETRPVSIAVFGAPGSGKSFGVKQVAAAVVPKSQLCVLTFNLSELDSAHDLVAALHQVRDAALRGLLPLVFWDEFDTVFEGQPRGWLRHFLAPMQDGEFRDGQLVHPVGRCIFVFAGGTAATLRGFSEGGDQQAFRAAKGPDFVSRLRGYVDVLGPDPGSEDDALFVVRRAILLRSLLQRNAPQLVHRHDGADLVDIDPGVLRAFLDVPRYKHGARSMESILTTSRLTGLDTFERSSLPAQDQLDLHVDGATFLALVDEPELAGGTLEELAQAAHEVFCEALRGRGYRQGDVTDDEALVEAALRPWSELDEVRREANRANVRDIPAKLARIGCAVVAARGGDVPFALTEDEVDLLARAEHERWRVHEADRPEASLAWSELSEAQRAKDRDLVVGIPAILGRLGYGVLRVRPPE